MEFNKPVKYLITLILGVFTLPSFVFAANEALSGLISRQIGTAFASTFPAWISLGGAVVVLVLALKYMSGGRLAGPFILVGVGVLVDAVVQIMSSVFTSGLISAPPYYPQVVSVAGLGFRLAVVIGVIWIAGVFGILRQKKSNKQESAS